MLKAFLNDSYIEEVVSARIVSLIACFNRESQRIVNVQNYPLTLLNTRTAEISVLNAPHLEPQVAMTTTWQIPANFLQSYSKFDTYPRNLLQQTSYPAVSEAYSARLQDVSAALFTDQEDKIHVPVREYTGQGKPALSAYIIFLAND